ncbi:MAG: hypothetical protein ABJB47_00705 [Actinomycetota bacterium]
MTDPAGLVLLPGAAEAVSRLNASGLRVILVTNQRWLSQPGKDPARYTAIHSRLTGQPAPGLLVRAAAEHRFDLAARS